MKYSSIVLLGLAIAMMQPQAASAGWVTVHKSNVGTTQVNTDSYVRYGRGIVGYASRLLSSTRSGILVAATERTLSCDTGEFRNNKAVLIAPNKEVTPLPTSGDFQLIAIGSTVYWEAQEVCQLSEP